MKNRITSKKALVLVLFDVLAILAFSYFPDYIVSPKYFSIYRLLIYIPIIVFTLSSKKLLRRVDKPTLFLIGLLYFIPLLSTLINYPNAESIFRGIRQLLGALAMVLFFFTRANTGSEQKNLTFLKHLSITLGALTLANIISIIALKGVGGMAGRESYYLLGNDNGTVFESFTFILISSIYGILKYKRIPLSSLLLYAVILMTYISVNSSNATVGILLMLVLLIFSKTKSCEAIAKPTLLLGAYAIFFFTIVIWRSDLNIITAILNLLGRDATFTGRTFIWDRSIQQIKLNKLIGLGYEPENITVTKILIVKCHNMILQLLYNGGILGTLPLIPLIKKTIRNTKLSQDRRVKTILLLSIFIFFIISTFDYYQLKYSLIFLILATFLPINNQKGSYSK